MTERTETASERTELLIGKEGLKKLADSHVTVVGIGGVGGHCTEALARAGVGRLLLVDPDTVRESNLNRQLIATKRTLGMKKTDAMRDRLRDVSDCLVESAEVFVTPENIKETLCPETDFIVDAIDSVPGKTAIALFGKEHGIPVISCMGAGNRMDPGAFRITDIFETSGCPLARKLRQELRKAGIGELPVVVSEETAVRKEGQTVIGSIAPVPAAAGLIAAGYVLNRLLSEK